MGNTKSYCRVCGNFDYLEDNGKCISCKGVSTTSYCKYTDENTIKYDCKGYCKKCGNYSKMLKSKSVCKNCYS
jgi:hypothetical protein